jgi:hypothetical protein
MPPFSARRGEGDADAEDEPVAHPLSGVSGASGVSGVDGSERCVPPLGVDGAVCAGACGGAMLAAA